MVKRVETRSDSLLPVGFDERLACDREVLARVTRDGGVAALVARDGDNRGALPVEHLGGRLGQRRAAERVGMARGCGARDGGGTLVFSGLLADCLFADSVAESVLVEDPAEPPLDGIQEDVPDGGPDPSDNDVAAAERRKMLLGGGLTIEEPL